MHWTSDVLVKPQPVLMDYAGPMLITAIIMTTGNYRALTRCRVLIFMLYCLRSESSQLPHEVDPTIIILILQVKRMKLRDVV